jgi:hypothetical protein
MAQAQDLGAIEEERAEVDDALVAEIVIELLLVQDALVMMQDLLTTVVDSAVGMVVDLLLVVATDHHLDEVNVLVMEIDLREALAQIEVDIVHREMEIEYKAQDDSVVETVEQLRHLEVDIVHPEMGTLLQLVVLVVLLDETDHSLAVHPEVGIAHIATTTARKLVLGQVSIVLPKRTLRCSSQEINIIKIIKTLELV